MKAVRFDRYGRIDVLRVADVPVPDPAQGQVLVKVKAASINPGEAKIREGWFHEYCPAFYMVAWLVVALWCISRRQETAYKPLD